VFNKRKDRHRAKEWRDVEIRSGMKDLLSRVAFMNATEVTDVITRTETIITRVTTGKMTGIDSNTGHATNVAIATDAE